MFFYVNIALKGIRRMEIHDVLKIFRKNFGFTQKEILTDVDPSVYSRIESGKQDLKVNDLKKIMNTLSLSPEEVFSKAPWDEEQRYYQALFAYCTENLQNQSRKKELVAHYVKLSKKSKSLREFSNYFAIKSYFSQKWSEIDSVTPKEVKDLYQLLVNKEYYQHYDYILTRNVMRFLEKEQADLLIKQIFLSSKGQSTPMNDSQYYILINAATSRIYEKEYLLARKYVQMAKKQDKQRKNLNYRINLKYLENLLDYLTIGDYQYMQRIQEYIHLAKDIGDIDLAQQISNDIKLVLNGISNTLDKNHLPIVLAKEY